MSRWKTTAAARFWNSISPCLIVDRTGGRHGGSVTLIPFGEPGGRAAVGVCYEAV
jgi:hypothetical protein